MRADAAASIASRPAFVTIASRPSGDETGELIEVILASVKAEYFSNRGWTGFADLPDGQFAVEGRCLRRWQSPEGIDDDNAQWLEMPRVA